MSRHHALRDLRVVDLEEEALLPVVRVPLLGHPVAGPPDLHQLLYVNPGLERRGLHRRVLGLLGGPPGQVALVLLALGVGQVARLVVVESQTQLALDCSPMVSHEVLQTTLSSHCHEMSHVTDD